MNQAGQTEQAAPSHGPVECHVVFQGLVRPEELQRKPVGGHDGDKRGGIVMPRNIRQPIKNLINSPLKEISVRYCSVRKTI